MIVGILDSTAFYGEKNKYPFAFQKKGVTSMRQFIQGEEYPYVTLELNGANDHKDRMGYYRFLEAAGAWLNNASLWSNQMSGDKTRIVPCLCGTTCPAETRMGPSSIPSRPAMCTWRSTISVWEEFESTIYIDHLGGGAHSMIPACKGTELLVGWRPWNWSP